MIEEEALEEIIKLANGTSDPATIKAYYKQQFFNGKKMLFDGTIITALLILEKYKAYTDYWDSSFGNKNPQYIKSVDKKMSISDFLVKGEYNKTFILPARNRDIYLFGTNSLNELKVKLINFNKRLNERKNTSRGN
jgi:hypothetical protein